MIGWDAGGVGGLPVLQIDRTGRILAILPVFICPEQQGAGGPPSSQVGAGNHSIFLI